MRTILLSIFLSLICISSSLRASSGDCISEIGEQLKIKENASYIELDSEEAFVILQDQLDKIEWIQLSSYGLASPATNKVFIVKIDFCDLQAGKYVCQINSNSNLFKLYKFSAANQVRLLKDFTKERGIGFYGAYRFPLYEFTVEEGDGDFSYLLYVNPVGGNLRLPFSFFNVKAFQNQILYQEIASGIIYGILLLMLIASIILSLALRDINFFYYTITLLGFTIFLGAKLGHLYISIFDRNENLSDTAAYFGLLLHSIGITGISLNILKLKERSTFYYYGLISFISVFVIAFISLSISFNFYKFNGFSQVLELIQFCAAFFPLGISLIALKIYIDYREYTGVFLVFSFLCSFLFLVIYSLVPHGAFSVYAFTYYKWLPVIESVIILFLLGLDYANSKSSIADLLKESITLKEQNLQSLLIARRNERKKISNFLHNRLGLKLGAIKLSLKDSDQKLMSLVDDVSKDIRDMSHNLNPKILMEKGLISAMKSEIYKIEDLNPDLIVDLKNKLSDPALTEHHIEVLYQCFLEIMQNILLHSDASQISIVIKNDKASITLKFLDNSSQIYHPDDTIKGSGLNRLRTELSTINGTLKIQPRADIEVGMAHSIFI